MAYNKVYLIGDELIERVPIRCPVRALGTGTKYGSQETQACFTSALLVYETTLKVGWYLKSHWQKAFPQHVESTLGICPIVM